MSSKFFGISRFGLDQTVLNPGESAECPFYNYAKVDPQRSLENLLLSSHRIRFAILE